MTRRLFWITVFSLFLAAFIWVFSPSHQMIDYPKKASSAFSSPNITKLGQALIEMAESHPGKSGFIIIDQGRQAYWQRVRLAALAEKSLDAQYYIWNSDRSGKLMAWYVLQAADRGVHVRLLLDDFNVGDRDTPLAALNSHENIEIRIYNPSVRGFRSGIRKLFGFLSEFKRLNRRMHNKTFVVDGSIGIVGGRNIGDEYFDIDGDINFRDRDILAVGPVVRDISDNFDVFWSSLLAIPMELLIENQPAESEIDELYNDLMRFVSDKSIQSLHVDDDLNHRIYAGTLEKQLIWANAELIHDDPASSENDNDDEIAQKVARRLGELALSARKELLVESAYLVTGEAERSLLTELKNKNVKIRALTNSLASNDVIPNHSAYARSRLRLLEHGVELYELRPDAESCRKLVQKDGFCDGEKLFSLHSKSMVVDRKTVYVGSFNVNLRSQYFNSETALIIESEELAESVARSIDENMQLTNAWEIRLDEKGKLQWLTLIEGKKQYYSHEPETSLWRRIQSKIFSLFPLEKYF